MIQVVHGAHGTAHQAQVDKVTVAGKTGTAQWGAAPKQKTAAWFAGYAPAQGPRIAFAALYEGEANNNDVHGGSNAAPMIGLVLREYFKDPAKAKPLPTPDSGGVPLAEPVSPTTEVPKAELVQPESPEKKEPPKKPSLWRRLFGGGSSKSTE
jgi:penicillin-binding protein 2